MRLLCRRLASTLRAPCVYFAGALRLLCWRLGSTLLAPCVYFAGALGLLCWRLVSTLLAPCVYFAGAFAFALLAPWVYFAGALGLLCWRLGSTLLAHCVYLAGALRLLCGRLAFCIHCPHLAFNENFVRLYALVVSYFNSFMKIQCRKRAAGILPILKTASKLNILYFLDSSLLPINSNLTC